MPARIHGFEKNVSRDLIAAFKREGVSAMGLCAPGAALYGSPKQQVDFADSCFQSLDVVPAHGCDIDARFIERADTGGPIVGLQRGVTKVVVADRENAKVAGIVALSKLMREGTIKQIDVELTPAIHLEDTTGGTRAENCYVVPS